MKQTNWWPLIIIASASGSVLAEVSDVGSPLRPAIIFWFMLFCPGMAFVRLLQIEDRLMELTVAIALSIGIDTVVSETMVLAQRWSSELGLIVLAGLSLAGVMLQTIFVTGRSYPPLEAG